MRNLNGINKANLNAYLNVGILSSKLRSMDSRKADEELLKWQLRWDFYCYLSATTYSVRALF